MAALAIAPLVAQSQSTELHIRFNSGQAVVPIYEGWERVPDGSFNMVFGYLNRNYKEELNIPLGPANIIAMDPAANRLEAAKQLGADVCVLTAGEARDVVAGLTDGLGAHVAIEAVGVPYSFELCADLVRPGGRIANVGVHGRPVTLHLERLWISDITITTGLVDTSSTPRLLAMLAAGQLSPNGLITHRFGIGEMLEAYDVFGQAADTGALKVALFRT